MQQVGDKVAVKEEIDDSRAPRKRRSYNCGPCRKQKIKCDLQIPCGNCVSHHRETECRANPPNPPTESQLLLKMRKKLRLIQRKNGSIISETTLVGEEWGNAHQYSPPIPRDTVHDTPIVTQQHFMPHIQVQHQVPINRENYAFSLHPQLPPLVPQAVPRLQNLHGFAPGFPPRDDPYLNGHLTSSIPQEFQPPVHRQSPSVDLDKKNGSPFQPVMMNKNITGSHSPSSVVQDQRFAQDQNDTFAPNGIYTTPISSDLDQSTNTNVEDKKPGQNADFYLRPEDSIPFNDMPNANLDIRVSPVKSIDFLKLETNPKNLKELKSYIFLALPPKYTVDQLIFHYLDKVNHQHDCLNRFLVTTTLNNFWTDMQRQNHDNVSYALLSLIFLVLSVSVLIMTEEAFLGFLLEEFCQSRFNKSLKPRELAEFFCDIFIRCFTNSSPFLKYDFKRLDSIDRTEELDLLRLQAYTVSKLYFHATKQWETAYTLLTHAISCAEMLGLSDHRADINDLLYIDDPIIRRAILEERRKLWWELCYTDTYMGLLFNKEPILRCCYSRVSFPSTESSINNSETIYHIIRYRVMRKLNRLMEIKELRDLPEGNSLELQMSVLRQILQIDKDLCLVEIPAILQSETVVLTLPPTRQAARMIQSFLINSIICISRFKLYQAYLPLRIPSFNAICYSVIISMYKFFDILKLNFPVRQFETFYLTIISELHAIMITSYLFLFETVECLSKEEKDAVMNHMSAVNEVLHELNKIYDSDPLTTSITMSLATLGELFEMKLNKCSVEDLLKSFKTSLEINEDLMKKYNEDRPNQRRNFTAYQENYLKQFYLDLFRLGCQYEYDKDLIVKYNSNLGVILPEEIVQQALELAEKNFVELDYLDSFSFGSQHLFTKGLRFSIKPYGAPRAI